ncbi:hypothetical protein BC826DRAFT_553007 [Russula brevipes]|nr:hypothetical protein BC826DRAFT_553007 [Russula brevipes]
MGDYKGKASKAREKCREGRAAAATREHSFAERFGRPDPLYLYLVIRRPWESPHSRSDHSPSTLLAPHRLCNPLSALPLASCPRLPSLPVPASPHFLPCPLSTANRRPLSPPSHLDLQISPPPTPATQSMPP